jgi:two-component system sensor kinase FixL
VSKQSKLTAESGFALAQICTIVAMICGVLPLFGWLTEFTPLRTLGFPSEPIRPLTGVAVIFVGMALFALIRDYHPALTRWLLAPVVLIGAMAVHVRIAPRMVFPPGAAGALTEVLPGLMSTALLILMSAAIALSASPSRASTRAAMLVTSVACGLGAAPIALMLEPGSAALWAWHPLLAPLPMALAAIGFSTALLIYQSSLWWPSALAVRQTDWPHVRLLLPILLVPIVASLFELQTEHVEFFPPVSAQMISMMLNIFVLAGLAFWVGGHASRQHAELEELTGALDTAPIIITDADGRIRHWSHGCEQLYGWSPAAALGRYKHELLRSQVITETAAPGTTARELRERRRDGESVHVVERLRRVERGDRPPTLIYTMTDISDRVRAETSLRESEERLALATSAYPIGIFESDGAGTLHWLEGSDERLGVPLEVLASRELRDQCIAPKDLEVIRSESSKAIAQRSDRISFSTRFSLPDGPERAMQIAIRYFYDAAGTLTRVVGIAIDATEAHQREKALAAGQAQLRSILATVPDAMIVTDERGVIRSFSCAAEALFGCSAEDAIGLQIDALLTGAAAERRPKPRKPGDAIFKAAIGCVRRFMALRADGTEIPIELRVGEALIGGERLFTAVARDISEQLESEARISTLRNDLNRAARLNAVSEMAAGLAHELNQPLAATVNFLGTAIMLLERKASAERIADLLQHASSEALRAGSIIRRLREFIAHRETERTIEAVEPTIREAANLVLAGQGLHSASVAYLFEPEVSHMLADRVQIQQVVVNLVRNSLDALSVDADRVGKVGIAARVTENDMVEISVSDNGPGIPDTMVGRLFQPFVSSKGDAGLGIGLSICRGIVEDHGGTLTAENTPGGGARFSFTVPIASVGEPPRE